MIKHTSAALSIAASSKGLPEHLEATLNSVVPNKWNREFFTHTYEGDDDMPVFTHDIRCQVLMYL